MAVSHLFIVKKHALVGQLHAVLKVVPARNFNNTGKCTLQKWRRSNTMQKPNMVQSVPACSQSCEFDHTNIRPRRSAAVAIAGRCNENA
jgi:hypothetical protein